MTHEGLYKQLRQSLLSRHFALSRYGRANYFTNENYLGDWPLSERPRATDRKTIECWTNWRRPQEALADGTSIVR